MSMAEIQIRPANATDLATLMAIDHTCQSDYVWQMDIQHEEGQAGAIFREIRLPRTVVVAYPRAVGLLSETWNRKSGMLVAVIDDQVVGYTRMNDTIVQHTAWLADLVVSARFRRQGIATMLIQSVQTWAVQRKNQRVLLEMSSKDNPAIHLAQKLGYEFCGYNDHYYASQDIALFFGRSIR
jgi:ribosomal protein S18 acetylase RimI-like enzyme